jgi:hypothetical protein
MKNEGSDDGRRNVFVLPEDMRLESMMFLTSCRGSSMDCWLCSDEPVIMSACLGRYSGGRYGVFRDPGRSSLV